MRKINIGTEKYTRVFAADEKEFNANHHYIVETADPSIPREILGDVYFQKGPTKENGVNGVANEDLIAMVIDRLQSFQESEFKCRENAIAITKLEECLLWLRKRTTDREKRGVEGKNII